MLCAFPPRTKPDRFEPGALVRTKLQSALSQSAPKSEARGGRYMMFAKQSLRWLTG
ncbi:hypothetical protein MPL1032_210084 [Mesorhizobium plurifarium]|uniref:Uncharacterized protein n=1 Tax=Mesorhizobium plurifarium TaxID=69974 RepID=A0A0K2VZA6_MESPL|nr:hypothetical protein MPL1032_210084 [Mesorhizobium plurifarium]